MNNDSEYLEAIIHQTIKEVLESKKTQKIIMKRWINIKNVQNNL